MVAGCGDKCIKYLLFIFNCIVMIGSLVLIGLCIWALVDSDASLPSITAVLGSNLYEVSIYIILAMSCVVFLVSLLGCCGACKEDRCCLLLFFIMVFILMLVLLVGSILAFVYHSKIQDKIIDQMTESLTKEYGQNEKVTNGWDDIQEHLQCCGVEGAKGDATATGGWYLYRQATNFYGNSNGYKVPPSCCVMEGDMPRNVSICTGKVAGPPGSPPNQAPPTTGTNPELYTKGCYTDILDTTEDNALTVGLIAFIIALVMIVAMIFAICLYRGIHNNRQY